MSDSQTSLSPEVLNLIISENRGSRLQKEILRKKINKLAKRRGLFRDALTPEWAFRVFTAEMLLGVYTWWGWECRSGWAWALANDNWFYPRWDGRPCNLLVLAEQGIGDEILFISCAKELSEKADVTWEVDDRLIPILERSIPEVNWVTRWKAPGEAYQLTDHRGDYDAFIPAGNVPKLFRRSRKDFPRTPYLVPKPHPKTAGVGYVDKAGAVLEKRAEVPGDFDLHHTGELYSQFETFDDFIAFVGSLDRVNAVPSAVVHICGAIGQKCNVIKPVRVYGEHNTILKWYYPRRRHMDWYGDHVNVYGSRIEFDHSSSGNVSKDPESRVQAA